MVLRIAGKTLDLREMAMKRPGEERRNDKPHSIHRQTKKPHSKAREPIWIQTVFSCNYTDFDTELKASRPITTERRCKPPPKVRPTSTATPKLAS